MNVKMLLAIIALVFFIPWNMQANVKPAPVPQEVWQVYSPIGDRDGNVIPDIDGNAKTRPSKGPLTLYTMLEM